MAQLTGAIPYVVHVSGRAPLEEIERVRASGYSVYAEICSHHLIFSEDRHRGDDGIRFVMTPPLRASENQQYLWDAFRSGVVSTLSSDHCHLRLDRDKVPAAARFCDVPAGIPGIAARIPLGFRFGVETGMITPRQLVRAACAAPAQIFDLYPRKGVLAPGADADVVVWDPHATTTLTADWTQDGLGWTPYESIEVDGGVRTVLADGDIVVEDGEWIGEEHHGRYLPCRRAMLRAGKAFHSASPTC
jgi:dihydropyrimidinase